MKLIALSKIGGEVNERHFYWTQQNYKSDVYFMCWWDRDTKEIEMILKGEIIHSIF